MKKRKRQSKRVTRRRDGAGDALPDRHGLYEACAQNPTRDVRMLEAIHADEPRVLGEDFCGTGALSRAWAALSPGHSAIAVDHDAEPLARAQRVARVRAIRADVMRVTARTDIIAVLNFSICELHTRGALVAYLRHALARLKRRGVLVLDIYGGGDAFNTGRIVQNVRLETGRRVRYEWEQRHADPLTGRVVNAMHFSVRGPNGRAVRLDDAFVYDWRLWSIPELREAMEEAGFTSSEVYPRFAEAQDDEGNLYVSPISDSAEVGESFSVYVVGRR